MSFLTNEAAQHRLGIGGGFSLLRVSSRSRGRRVNEGAGRLAGCLMSRRESARGDPGGGQSPSSGLQPDPVPVAPFFPIFTVAGSIRKQKAPKRVDMRHFPPSTFGGGGV